MKKGLLVVGAVGILALIFKDKIFGKSEATQGDATGVSTNRGYSLQLPTGAIYQVIGNKTFAFVSEAAWRAFQSLGGTDFRTGTDADLAGFTSVGFVDVDGIAKDNNGMVYS